jgi:hypothetical protein
MRRIVVAGTALMVALAVGFGVGWLVFDRDHEGSSDADLACEQAATTPTEYFAKTTSASDTLRTNAIATLAQVAGERSDDPTDLDALGEAGASLRDAIRSFDEDGYAEARQDLLDACADR